MAKTPTDPPDPPTEAAEPAAVESVDIGDVLTVPVSRVRMTGYKSNKLHEIEKEAKRHAGLVEKRTKNRKAKAVAKAKETPIQARKKLLTARLTKYHSKKQATNYRVEQIEAWARELEIILKTPKSWKHGRGGAKKQTLEAKLDRVLAMDKENDN